MLGHLRLLLFILAQLWRFTKEGRLENKLKRWSNSYGDMKSFMDSEGILEVQDISKVFTLDEYTKQVTLAPRDISVLKQQKWNLGQQYEDGWWTIQKSDSDFYLSLSS